MDRQLREISVEIMIPPRYVPQKMQLLEVGREMKAHQVIRRYDVVMRRGEPMLRTVDGEGQIDYHKVNEFRPENQTEAMETAEETENEEICVICQERLMDPTFGPLAKMNQCEHKMHFACAKRYLLGQSTKCPICNAENTNIEDKIDCSKCKGPVPVPRGLANVRVAACGHPHYVKCQGDYLTFHQYNIANVDAAFFAQMEDNLAIKCQQCATQGPINQWLGVGIGVVGEARGNRGPAAPGAGAGAPRRETVTNGGGAARGRAVARGGTAVRAAAQPQGPRYTARRGALRGVARGAMGRGRGGGQVVGNNILLTGGNTEALGGNANYENDLVDEQL